MPDTTETRRHLAAYLHELFQWMKDERETALEPGWNAAYDAFRGRYNSAWLDKWRKNEGAGWRSTVFVRLTKTKVMTGYSQVMAILLQAGKLPWDLKSRMEIQDEAAREVEDAKVEAMHAAIENDLAVCRADRVLRESVLEMALYGASWLRCPVIRPKDRLEVAYTIPGFQFAQDPALLAQFGRATLIKRPSQSPVVEHPSLWDVFWDMEVSDPSTEGNGIFVRRQMTAGRFAALMDLPGYDKDAINRVLETSGKATRGKDETSERPNLRYMTERRAVVPVYEFHGLVPRSVLKGQDVDVTQDAREVEVSCVIAGETPECIRKPMLNEMPYRPLYMCPWEALPNEAASVGIAENVRDSQGIVNGLTRAFLDAKALSSNPMLGVKPEKLAPGQGRTSFPGKIWEVSEQAQSVREAIEALVFPDVTPGLMEAVQMFSAFADQESGLPKLLSGEIGPRQPDTAFEMAQYVESANRGIGSVIRNIDERHIEPIVTSLYHWHMLTDEEEAAKGDFLAEATGFASYQDKLKRGTNLLGLWNLAMSNPASAPWVKVGDFLTELAKTRDVEPDRIFKTEQEMQEAAAQAAQMLPPPGGVVEGMPGGVGGGPPPVGDPAAMADQNAMRAEIQAMGGGGGGMPQ